MIKNDEPLKDFASWKHLLYVAEKLKDLPQDKPMAEIKELLESLNLHFPRGLSPVDDFQGYAVRQFCKALSEALENIERKA